MSLLRAVGLRKRYRRRTILQDVSIEVASGEVVGLLGPNGAGKTTSFYMLVGLVPVDGGQIFIDEHEVTHEPVYRRARLGLSYLPQESSIFRRMTVADNISAILELQGHKGAAVEEHLQHLLDDLHIDHLRDAAATSLSGGERRRVEIARTLAMRPRFVLLDEPFAGIDPLSVVDIQKIIRFLVERDIGVLITDHNVREMLGICDRAYILSEGRVMTSGRPDEIVYNEDVRRVYLGEGFRL
ncbi:MAG: LPS export ABC transporter ATP-binding protein [Betaproteobacteria bacterium]|nr:LPS export ABC transporter ATP-binding protein [Betaproteobacteria bacterium]